ncbi:hypothetical protein D3C81_519830 [compost metagenome]
MTALVTKKSKVIEALKNQDYKAAMKIAKAFHIELTKEENTIVRRAYEMTWGSSFYEQLGFNKEEEFNKAVEILKNKYL